MILSQRYKYCQFDHRTRNLMSAVKVTLSSYRGLVHSDRNGRSDRCV